MRIGVGSLLVVLGTFVLGAAAQAVARVAPSPATSTLAILGRTVCDAGGQSGRITTYQYDLGGKVTRVTLPIPNNRTSKTVGSAVTTYTYGDGTNGANSNQRSAYNSRGDVVSVSDGNGDATWQAAYEAYGTKTEQGGNAERQRANTKDEDPTGLLNEGLRYRDLAAGVFISRDPAGFIDGPSYCP